MILTAISAGVADQDRRRRASCAATAAATCRRAARGRAGAARRRRARRRLDQRARAGRGHRPPRRRRAGRLPGHDRLLWQQAGRAGRRAERRRRSWWRRSAPLDQFMVDHPDYLFGAAAEHARINPDNLLSSSTTSSAPPSSCPSTAASRSGSADARRDLAALEDEGMLHRAGGRWHWATETYPADHISLRTVTTDNFLVIDTTARDDKQTKRRQIIAEVDWGSAFATIYPKAIYLVESEPFEVQELHFREDEEKVAYVKRVSVDYFTDAISAKGVWILRPPGRSRAGRLGRRAGRSAGGREGGGLQEDQDGHPRERRPPARSSCRSRRCRPPASGSPSLRTVLARASLFREELIDGLRAVTHLLHHLAPDLLALRHPRPRLLARRYHAGRDGGRGHARKRQAAPLMKRPSGSNPTIYLYDSHAGGIGLSERVFDVLPLLLQRGLETLQACACRWGCPSCVGPVRKWGAGPRPRRPRSCVNSPTEAASRKRDARRAAPDHPADRDRAILSAPLPNPWSRWWAASWWPPRPGLWWSCVASIPSAIGNAG